VYASLVTQLCLESERWRNFESPFAGSIYTDRKEGSNRGKSKICFPDKRKEGLHFTSILRNFGSDLNASPHPFLPLVQVAADEHKKEHLARN
jgi:hypothetical protein